MPTATGVIIRGVVGADVSIVVSSYLSAIRCMDCKVNELLLITNIGSGARSGCRKSHALSGYKA